MNSHSKITGMEVAPAARQSGGVLLFFSKIAVAETPRGETAAKLFALEVRG